MDLSLSIPQNDNTDEISLETSLEYFTSTEKMDICGYKCSKCQSVDTMEKDISVFRMPRVLVIHLKRFDNFGRKITTKIQIPKVIDMSKYQKLGEDLE